MSSSNFLRMIQCSKPRCSRPGTVVLAYDYLERTVSLEERDSAPVSPHLYLMCTECSDRLSPPLGWQLTDRRAPASIAG